MNSDAAPIPVEELLADAAWTRALAGSLVPDPATADDLVQETHRAALDRPPAEGTPTRAWLRTVVRNFAKKGWRSESRRREREMAAARPEKDSLPGPEELASRLETQRMLARLVSEMKEPFRATLILRYWEGLSSKEIGARLGVSAGTVRWRLKKAIEELRARLDADHDGERKAWIALLLPIGLRPPKQVGVVAGLSGLLALKNLSIVAALVVAAALGTQFFGVTPPESPKRPPGPVESLTAAADADPSDAVLPEADPEEKPAGVTNVNLGTEASRGRIRLRVLDRDGEPIEGATVSFHSRTGEFASGGDGSVVVETDRMFHDPDTFRLVVRAPGFARKRIQTSLRPGEERALADVVLEPGGDVVGVVTRPDGHPYAGATVRLVNPGANLFRRPADQHATLTRKDGSFRIANAPAGSWAVEAMDTRMRKTRSRAIEIRPGEEPPEVAIQLVPFGPKEKFEGVVLDPDGQPVSRALVRWAIRWADGRVHESGSQVADEKGRFFLSNLNEGVSGDFAARDPDQRYRAARIDGYEVGTGEIVLRLERSRRMTVTVPRADARIEILAQATDDELWRLNTKAHVAAFAPPGVPFRIRVVAEGFAPKTLGPWNPDDAPESLTVALVERPGICGTTLPGARLAVHGFLPPNMTAENNGFAVTIAPRLLAKGVAGPDGRFRLHPQSDAARLFVRVTAVGHAPAESEPFEFDPTTGVTGLDLRPGRGGTIEGRVIVPGGGIPNGTIVGFNRGDGYGFTVTVGPDGAFRVEHLTPGPWQVIRCEREVLIGSYFESRSYGRPKPIPFNCRVTEEAVTRFDLTLEAGPAVLTGHLLIDGEAPKLWRAGIYPATGGLVPAVEADLDRDGGFRLGTSGGRRRLIINGPGPLLGRRFLVANVDLLGETRLDIAWKTGLLEIEPTNGESNAAYYHRAEVGEGVLVLTPIENSGGELRVPAGPGDLVRFEFQKWMRPEEWARVGEVSVTEGGEAKISLPPK